LIRSSLVRRPIDFSVLLGEVSDNANGATSLFVGTVRSSNDGKEVLMIEYSAYEEMAAREMDLILGEAAAQFEVTHIAVEHRLGELAIGEASVAIATAHPRRAPAMDSMRYVIEQLKQRVPIWKLEHYADGSRNWVNAGTGQAK
jgi:Molybdopterin converting factor, large subunit